MIRDLVSLVLSYYQAIIKLLLIFKVLISIISLYKSYNFNNPYVSVMNIQTRDAKNYQEQE